MDNEIILTDDSGQEVVMEIVLTFDNEKTGRKFVLVTSKDPEDEDVIPFVYDEDGNIEPVTDENEFNDCREVLEAFLEEVDG